MNLKNKNLHFLPSIKRKFNLHPWAFSFSILALFIILQSCTPIREVAPQNTKTEMLLKAKSLFKQKAEASAARKAAANSRDIDVASLFPEWDNNRLTKSLDEKQIDVLQVFIKKNADQFWSLDFLTLNDTQIIRIRKYTKHDGCLTIYDVDGRFLEKGNYDPVKGTYAPFLTRDNLSKQARIASNVEFIRDGDEWIVIWNDGNVYYSTRIPVNTGEIGGNIDGPWNQGNGNNNGSTGNGDGNNESGGGNNESNNERIKNETNNPCIEATINKLKSSINGNEITQIFQRYNTTRKYNFTLKENDTDFPPNSIWENSYAFTEGTVITLHSSKLKKASQEMIAAVILHEMMHVELNGSEIDDHNEIGNNYVTPLAEYINNIFGLPIEIGKQLIWNGLSETPLYDQMFNIDQQFTIQNTARLYTNENGSYTNYGTHCNN